MNMVFLDTGTLNRKTSEMFIIYIEGRGSRIPIPGVTSARLNSVCFVPVCHPTLQFSCCGMIIMLCFIFF